MSGARTLSITEGPTDCAALLDLGFDAVGRPSCEGGTDLLLEYVKLRRPQRVAVFADADAHGGGQRGAMKLANAMARAGMPVRVITPPASVKDVREWKRRGMSNADVRAALGGPADRIVTARKEVL
jgi:hypothetical protein